VRETGALDPSTLRFSSPFGAGLFSQGLFSGGSAAAAAPSGALSVKRFASVVFLLGPIGWVLEAFVTALVLGYISQVRPSLLFGGVRPERRPPGDETGGH
jgi:ABC-type Co2+ transport system permease subunit